MLIRPNTGNTPVFLALDGGTGSCRALLFDSSGNEIAIGQREWHHQPTPGAPGGVDFDIVKNALLFDEVISEVLGDIDGKSDRIQAISTTSMREGLVLYDSAGNALWACPNVDGRAQAEADDLTREGLADKIYELSGDWVSITAPARFRWIARNRPDVMDKAHKFGMLSDWIATRLTGNYTTEPSCGSSSAMFDIRNRTWAAEIFNIIGVDQAICPEVVESGEQCGVVTASAAARTGLKAGTPVVAGGGDTQLALVGLGQQPGQATLVGGSFWQFTTLTSKPVIDPKRRGRTLCHAVPNQWMTEGIGFLTGFSLRWFRDAFCELEECEAIELSKSVFTIMEEKASAVPTGANGLHAIMSSAMQSDAWVHGPPSFMQFDIGNAASSNRITCIRALMETGAFVADLHRHIVADTTEQQYDSVVFTGGSAQGILWPQIISDTMNLPIEISSVKETTALGAAVLAAVGVGTYSSVEDASDMTSGIERVVEPNRDNHAIYVDKMSSWKKLDSQLIQHVHEGLVRPMWQAAGGKFES